MKGQEVRGLSYLRHPDFPRLPVPTITRTDDRSYCRVLACPTISLCASVSPALRRSLRVPCFDIVAYPDPSPPMVEVITQYPGWSAEQIERQITIPIEIALQGMPGLPIFARYPFSD